MKNWLMAIGGGLIIVVAICLIVIFAPQVLLFLEGIVGILVGIAGGIILAIGISGVKARFEEKRKEKIKVEPAKANPAK
ncbi:hypothetical protein HQ584_09695 [Patescibacteria group bacterium]|nr:hypothetical protein [Patescibacteria group bacterium]